MNKRRGGGGRDAHDIIGNMNPIEAIHTCTPDGNGEGLDIKFKSAVMHS